MTDTTAQAASPAVDDFSSIVLTIDHLAATPHPGGHQIHKFVCSTQSLVESVIGLIDYYKLDGLLRVASTHEMFAKSMHGVGLPVFILHTAENTQVVSDADVWAVLMMKVGEGSMLKTTEHMIDMVGKSLSDQIAMRGQASTLNLLMFSSFDEDAPLAEAAE